MGTNAAGWLRWCPTLKGKLGRVPKLGHSPKDLQGFVVEKVSFPCFTCIPVLEAVWSVGKVESLCCGPI
jgi:hypothetical protein